MSTYKPMSAAELAGHLGRCDDSNTRWRLVAEFLKEYGHEPAGSRATLLLAEPAPTGDERWDVFLAALAKHLAAVDERGAPAWTVDRLLVQFWFPFDTPAARADALVHAPASFRRRGIFVAARDVELV